MKYNNLLLNKYLIYLHKNTILFKTIINKITFSVFLTNKILGEILIM